MMAWMLVQEPAVILPSRVVDWRPRRHEGRRGRRYVVMQKEQKWVSILFKSCMKNKPGEDIQNDRTHSAHARIDYEFKFDFKLKFRWCGYL